MRWNRCFKWLWLLVTGCGLIDASKAESENIVGKIYVVNLHLPEHPGFYPIFYFKPGVERNLLKSDDAIDYLKSDDSVMIIKTLPAPDTLYYMVKHNKGDSILEVREWNDFEFENYEKKMEVKYEFRSKR